MTCKCHESDRTGENSSELFSESPFAEFETPSESLDEWASPFASGDPSSRFEQSFDSEVEQTLGEFETIQPFEAPVPEYGESNSAFESEWESPFAPSSFTGDDEVFFDVGAFSLGCGDVSYPGLTWPFAGKPDVGNRGQASTATIIPSAEVIEFRLQQFDVDRYELKPAHREAIDTLAKRIATNARQGRYSGKPIMVFAYGETSSTGDYGHNVKLSKHRAFNVLNAIQCRLKALNVSVRAYYGMYGTGEQSSRTGGPDNSEQAEFRGVIVRVISPLKPPSSPGPRICPPQRTCPECPKCRLPPVVKGQTSVCASITRIAPRSTSGLPPDLIPLTPIIPGLPLAVALVTRATADIRIDAQPEGRTGVYRFKGWGIEIALPTGKVRADLRADLRLTLDLLVKASASLAGRLQLGPLKLVLRINASALAQLIVRLCAQLRARLEIDLGHPHVPELTRCRPVQVNRSRGAFPFNALVGSATLVVPGPGYGTARLGLNGPQATGLGLAENPLSVAADKSTVKTLLALAGDLSLAQVTGRAREAEFESLSDEWPQTMEDFEEELQPFM